MDTAALDTLGMQNLQGGCWTHMKLALVKASPASSR